MLREVNSLVFLLTVNPGQILHFVGLNASIPFLSMACRDMHADLAVERRMARAVFDNQLRRSEMWAYETAREEEFLVHDKIVRSHLAYDPRNEFVDYDELW